MHGNFGQMVSSAEAMFSCLFILVFGAVALCGTGVEQLPVVLKGLNCARTSTKCQLQAFDSDSIPLRFDSVGEPQVGVRPRASMEFMQSTTIS